MIQASSRAYSRLPRSVKGLRIVDLGCGFGWFCRWAREHGAAQVLGLDVSEKMLARAQAETADPAIVYERVDLERLELPEAAFDLAYSSLTLHYLPDLDPLRLRYASCAGRELDHSEPRAGIME